MGVGGSTESNETCDCGKPIDESCKADNYNSKLVGTVKKLYERHILLCTGALDWEPKITKEEGSFASLIGNEIKKSTKAHADITQPMLTAVSEKSRGEEGTIDIIVYPEAIRYIGVKQTDISSFVEDQVIKGKICESIKHEKVDFKHLVLICTHNSRDKRCGRIGPQVMTKLDEILQSKDIKEDQVAVRGTSHLGGHKYAAVIVVYPEGDWYGQMSARDAEELVDVYINCHGKPLTNKWRGKMGETVEESKKRIQSSSTTAPSNKTEE